MEKVCSNRDCLQVNPLPVEAFNKNSKSKDGYQKYCSKCSQSKKKTWYLVNKDQELIKIKNYQQEHKTHLAKMHNAYMKFRKKHDPAFKIACNLRIRVNAILSGKNKKGSAVKELGCSTEEFKKYLESKFKPGMNWNNHSQNGWHIDHKKPLIDFDLEDIEQFKQACHYTNLQPLWKEDHVAKTTVENLNRVK